MKRAGLSPWLVFAVLVGVVVGFVAASSPARAAAESVGLVEPRKVTPPGGQFRTFGSELVRVPA